MDTVARHIIAELTGCNEAILEFVEDIRPILISSADIAQLTIHTEQCKQFSPVGVTGFLLLSESHISIHTWPENGYAAVDAYTCGDGNKAILAINFIAQQLQAREIFIRTFQRGILTNENIYKNFEE